VIVVALSSGIATPLAAPTPAAAATASPAQGPGPDADGRIQGLAQHLLASLTETRSASDRATVELALLGDIERSGLEPQDSALALTRLGSGPLTPAQRGAVQALVARISSLMQDRATSAISLRGPMDPEPASVIVHGGPPPPFATRTPDYPPGR
jgi:hypothetical protein